MGRARTRPAAGPPAARRPRRLDALATAISERDGFFDAAFDAVEYDPDGRRSHVGDLRLRFVRGRHYVPAWGVVVEAPDGARLGLHRRHRAVDLGRGRASGDADLLLVESRPARQPATTIRNAAT